MSYDCCGNDGRVTGDSFVAALRNVHRIAYVSLQDLVADAEHHQDWLWLYVLLVVVLIVGVVLTLALILVVLRLLRRYQSR